MITVTIILCVNLSREAETRDPRSRPYVSQGIAQGALATSGGEYAIISENKGV